MLQPGSHVFLDTNVIIEAHRAKVWKAINATFHLDTVTRCIEELNTGWRQPIAVDTAALTRTMDPKQPTQAQLATLRMRYPGSVDMDLGEKELIAYILSLTAGTWFVCSPDKAAIRAAHVLGIIERYVALEHLTEAVGLKADLRRQYTKAFLSEQRSKLTLEML